MTKRAPVVVPIALLVGGCGAGEAAGPRLDVYAASSLTDVFTELEPLFEQTHDADVVLTFAGSQVLRIQIDQGAPADVFASADPRHVAALLESGAVTEGSVFAENELVVIVPHDNPAQIDSFRDLPKASRLVLGTTAVPAGRYAREMLSAADSLLSAGFSAAVLAGLASEESNVRLARAKVELGEADASIVYVTDARVSDRVRTIPIPPDINVRADYHIAAVAGGERNDLADAWIDLVLSSEGRAALARHGFVVE